MSIDRITPVTPGHAQHDVALGSKNSASSFAPFGHSPCATRVQLSTLTRQIDNEHAQDINPGRIAAIKAAIAAGELPGDSDKIAQSLLQDILQFS
ncbi:flagellar biosynthesis anti-sigma factor FlgM [Entomohabitans teleogrylli]|uniref:flagellar biosynthesis anti-sigma factor FlgM n=1 Tax=Entomohabitans teleogrylli TaxID=1384589 RepID=UPI00073D7491|nr:flagellar biosynthesis anti-sigma factor FlgM [Entomohabitans teleogrylli]